MTEDQNFNEHDASRTNQSMAEPTQPPQSMIEPQQDRGLLDLAVELSLRDITAGSDFALFVKIKNPFAKPIWIRDVHVSLPSELQLVDDPEQKKRQQDLEAQREEEQRKADEATQQDHEERAKLREQLEALQSQLAQLAQQRSDGNEVTDDLQQLIRQVEWKISNLSNQLSLPGSRAIVQVEGNAFLRNIKIASQQAIFQVEGDMYLDDSEISGLMTSSTESSDPRRVQLVSDRPTGAALQPGNTSIYKVVLKAKNYLLFRPSQYRLQFSVNYSFERPSLQKKNTDDWTEEQKSFEGLIFTNSISHELSIRTSLLSVMAGSAIGGLIGSALQLLQNTQIPEPATVLFTVPNIIAFLITLTTAVILSVIAIIFTARKSETQSFVAVEDFWGGLLIGFLIGYTGTSFFENLTNISELTNATP